MFSFFNLYSKDDEKTNTNKAGLDLRKLKEYRDRKSYYVKNLKSQYDDFSSYIYLKTSLDVGKYQLAE
ncbi:hypothetical protein N9L02_03015, partial [Gammaproteobacteria bacterium]|nr:hypothetical protein [Gammaproteobacteria bacterium]